MSFVNHRFRLVVIALFILLVAVLAMNAWIVDDAYITFRTVNNFVHGRGLGWNPGERVQAYSHPLWMFAVSFCYSITSELFFTVIAMSIALTTTAVFVAARAVTSGFQQSHWKIVLLVATLVSSKAVIDFSSSGLENCLSYLLAALFLSKYGSVHLSRDELRRSDLRKLAFLAALACVNRMDMILLYAPALACMLWQFRGCSLRPLFVDLLIAFSPVLLWMLFSLVYYGYPFPNTAYAKEFCTGFPASWKMHRGLEYLMNSFAWDTFSYLLLGGVFWLGIRSKSPRVLAAIFGIALYMVYTVFSAASATHMSGRFFAVPLFMAMVLLAFLAPNPRFGMITVILALVYIAYSPVSAVKFGTSLYRPHPQQKSSLDTKWHVANEGAALINWRPGKRMPDHAWYHEGERIRQRGEKIILGGAAGSGGAAIGYFGYAAGPDICIVDRLGLADPFLAHLPAVRPRAINQWISGHFERDIPAGYFESVERGTNVIQDPNLRKYYDDVRIITRGQLFSLARLQAIARMNGQICPRASGH